jgi:hypothetical protein
MLILRIVDEEKAREEAKKKLKEEEFEQSPCASSSIHSVSVEEVEEGPTDKKRRDKERVLKKKNDVGKKK